MTENNRIKFENAVIVNNFELADKLFRQIVLDNSYIFFLMGEVLIDENFESADYLMSIIKIDSKNEYDYITLLKNMIERGKLKALQFLLDYNSLLSEYVIKSIWDISLSNRNLEVMHILLDKAIPLSFSDYNLTDFSEKGIISLIVFLLENSVEISKQNYIKLFFIASKKGYNQLVDFVLSQYSININSKDEWNITALDYALSNDNFDMINHLLDLGVTFKENLLSDVVKKGSVETAKKLLEYGADVNFFDPIHYAIKNNQPEMVQLLVDYGANVENSLINSSSQFNNFNTDSQKIIRILIKTGAIFDHNSFVTILNKGYIEIIDLLMDSGYRIDEYILISALENGLSSMDSVKYLTKHITKREYFNKSVLNIALKYSSLEIVKYLAENGYQEDEDSGFYAIKSNSIEKLDYLLSLNSKINLNSFDKRGRTLLIDACIENEKEIVKHLIDLGADVNFRSKYDWPPLMFACKRQNSDIIKLLVNEGADVNANVRDSSVLSLATKYQEKEIVDFLKKSGI